MAHLKKRSMSLQLVFSSGSARAQPSQTPVFPPMIIAKSWSVVQLEFQGNILVRLSFQLSASNTYIHTYMCRVLYNKKSKRSSRLGQPKAMKKTKTTYVRLLCAATMYVETIQLQLVCTDTSQNRRRRRRLADRRCFFFCLLAGEERCLLAYIPSCSSHLSSPF